MSLEDVAIIGLMASNAAWIAYGLMMRQQTLRLRREMLARVQWNWRQAKQWKN